jgi:CubicO group peptidase (beta-lactamase class C family)
VSIQGFRRVCEDAAARWDVPALAVGVSLDGRRETLGVGCDPAARFRVASITKPFTATLAAELLDLDAPVGAWPGVSVRQLLAHTSGRDCEVPGLERLGDGDDALERVEPELAAVRTWGPPGVVWSYANTGYWLAGLLAARAAGSTYEAALQALVCERAGLDRTDFGEPDLDGWAVALDGSRAVAPRGYPRARRPSGGLVSTVGDLLRFGEWHLASPARAALREPVIARADGWYGLGFFVEEVGGRAVQGHGGSYGGFQTSLLLVPSAGAVFVGLAASSLGAQALRLVEDAFLEAAVGTPRPVRDTVPVGAAVLERLAGRYRQPDLELEVAPAAPGLALRLRDARGEQALSARPLGGVLFEVSDGQAVGHRFDFPLDGFVRFSSRLAERVA